MDINNDNLFATIESQIKLGLEIISKFNEVLKSSNPYTRQRRVDYSQGLVRRDSGIFVSLKNVEHRILFESYEIHALEVSVQLTVEILKNVESSLVQFSLRTLLEISFEKIRIIFSSELTKKHKEKYKAIMLLADYGFMSNHSTTFYNLYKEFRNEFDTKQIKILDELNIAVAKQSPRQYLIKKVRMLVNDIQDDLLKLLPPITFIKMDKLDALNSSLSHILHGNFTLILSLFIPKRAQSNLLRIYTIVYISIINILISIRSKVSGKREIAKIDELVDTYKLISAYTAMHWKEFE